MQEKKIQKQNLKNTEKFILKIQNCLKNAEKNCVNEKNKTSEKHKRNPRNPYHETI